jgi:hypothetical protein
MHTGDKANDRGESSQRDDPMAAARCRFPFATSGNFVWSFHATQPGQAAVIRCFRAGTDTVRALDFPLADGVGGMRGSWTLEMRLSQKVVVQRPRKKVVVQRPRKMSSEEEPDEIIF